MEVQLQCLLLALIALFFNYAVEADIRLLAFYLPDRKGFVGMNSQRLDPGSLVEWRLL